MNQTNYLLFDFLEFAPQVIGDEVLWKACSPTGYHIEHGVVILEVPFQAQKTQVDVDPDLSIKRKIIELKVRAYSNQSVRLSLEINESTPEESEMLQFDPSVEQVDLELRKSQNQWIIQTGKGVIKAVLDFSPIEVDHWSDLLPEPHDTLRLSVFPDGENPVSINSYDQFFPARNDGLALAFVEKNGKADRVTFSLNAKPDEKFVGSGERFTKMDLSGRTVQLKNQDGQGVNNRRTYKNIPFYISSEGYGLFVHTSAYSKFSFADHSTRSVQTLVEHPVLDCFFLGGGSPSEIIRNYHRLTGFPQTPPLWSYGIWMSRMTYFSEEEVKSICSRLREEKFPCDVIHLDTGWFATDWLCEWKFNPERFPDPKKFMSDLKSDGYRVSLWQMPYVAENAAQHEEAKANKFIGPLNQSREQGGSNFSNLDYAGTIDFTSPKATEWYKGLLQELLEMGAVCIKTDFGEDIHMDATYENMSPALLNNLYALLYQKAAYDVTKEVTGEGIIWARAGWAGCHRYPLHWGGDAACSWDGMAGSLKGGLHLGLSGFAFWSHDVPGFHGVPNFMNSVIPNDLYVRWTQFGVFTSHIRYHGTSKREPYEFPEIADIVRDWWNLRYALISYIVEQSKEAISSGYPLLQALIFHHWDDRTCWHIDDQYYFGNDFLVAPIMNSENKRDVYLPEGEWVDFFSGEGITGGIWLKGLEVSLLDMPVWVRKGAKIPFYPEKVQCTDEMDLNKSIELKIDSSFNGIWKILNK